MMWQCCPLDQPASSESLAQLAKIGSVRMYHLVQVPNLKPNIAIDIISPILEGSLYNTGEAL